MNLKFSYSRGYSAVDHSATDYDVWQNGWKSGETAVRYRFLPNQPETRTRR